MPCAALSPNPVLKLIHSCSLYIRLAFLPRSVWNNQTQTWPPSPEPNPSFHAKFCDGTPPPLPPPPSRTPLQTDGKTLKPANVHGACDTPQPELEGPQTTQILPSLPWPLSHQRLSAEPSNRRGCENRHPPHNPLGTPRRRPGSESGRFAGTREGWAHAVGSDTKTNPFPPPPPPPPNPPPPPLPHHPLRSPSLAEAFA